MPPEPSSLITRNGPSRPISSGPCGGPRPSTCPSVSSSPGAHSPSVPDESPDDGAGFDSVDHSEVASRLAARSRAIADSTVPINSGWSRQSSSTLVSSPRARSSSQRVTSSSIKALPAIAW